MASGWMAGQIHDYPVIINIKSREALMDFFAAVPALLADVHQGDTLRLIMMAVEPNPLAATNPSMPWRYVQLSTNLKVGIGLAAEPPELGTFYLQFGSATSGTLTSTKRYKISTYVSGDDFTNVGAASNATGVVFTASGTTPTTWTNGSTVQEITADLAYNATAVAVAAALNAMASITAAGGITATGDDGGPYRILFTSAGNRDSITGNGDALYPSTSVEIYTVRHGTTALAEIQTIALERQPAALCDFFTTLPSAAVTVETLQEGDTDVPDVQRITLDPQPYGGTFTLTFDGVSTAAIPFDTTAEELQTALAALSNIGYDTIDDEEVANVLVAGTSPQWTVSFRNSLGTGDQAEMTGDASGLLVPLGVEGEIDLNTEGILNLLGAEEEVDLTFEVEDESKPVTLLHTAITVINDLIPDNPGAPRDIPTYLTEAETNQQFLPGIACTAFTGGAAGALDALETDDFLTPGPTIRFAIVAGVPSLWNLQTNTGGLTEDAAGGRVLPDDAHAVTNNVIWIKVW